MTDREREERAIWRLKQGCYRIERRAGRDLLTTDERIDEIDDLAQLVALAGAIYDRVWAGRRITPSA